MDKFPNEVFIDIPLIWKNYRRVLVISTFVGFIFSSLYLILLNEDIYESITVIAPKHEGLNHKRELESFVELTKNSSKKEILKYRHNWHFPKR